MLCHPQRWVPKKCFAKDTFWFHFRGSNAPFFICEELEDRSCWDNLLLSTPRTSRKIKITRETNLGVRHSTAVIVEDDLELMQHSS